MNRQAFVKEKRTLQIRLDTPSAHVMLMLRCAVSQCPIRPKGFPGKRFPEGPVLLQNILDTCHVDERQIPGSLEGLNDWSFDKGENCS